MVNDKNIILFNGHDFRFLQPIINYFREHPKYEILIDDHPGHKIVDFKKSCELLNKSKLIFCEWALGNAEWYSKNKGQKQILIIRLHSQELKSDYLKKINWENVNKIIFINFNTYNIFLKKFPHLINISQVIFNPINSIKFRQPKLSGSIFNIGLVGISPKLKSPDIAVSILNRLKSIDNRFKLIIKGKMPWEYDWLWNNPNERKYYEKFFYNIERITEKGDIIFEPFGKDVCNWFSKIGFILSTSEYEGSHQVVAEGMASGSIPIIRNWYGADSIYPTKYIFDSQTDAVYLINRFMKDDSYSIEAEYSRNYSFLNFDQSIINPQYEDLFSKLLEEIREKNLAIEKRYHHTQILDKLLKRSIKVMIVCYINPGTNDGYVTRVVEECRLLKSCGIQVILLVYFDKEYLKEEEKVKKHLSFLQNATGAYVHLRPSTDFFSLEKVLKEGEEIEAEIVKLSEFYGVRIIHGESIYPSSYSLKACKKIGGKFVFDVHGIAPEESEMNKEPVDRVEVLKTVEEQIINFSDAIIFVSSHMKKHYQKKYDLSFTNSLIIPTCVESKKFRMSFEERIKIRESKGLADKFVFLYMGTLSVWQWTEAMFTIFGQIQKQIENPFFFLLLPNDAHNHAYELLSELGIPRKNFLIKQADHNEIGSIISIADAGLLLRKANPVNLVSYPTKAGEYLAAGVPIITTENVGDVTEVVKERKLGLIISPTDEGISSTDEERIKSFIDDIALNREKWFNHCRKFAYEKLDWSLYGELLFNTYSKLKT